MPKIKKFLVEEILNVSSLFVAQNERDGSLAFKATEICNLLGFPDEKSATWKFLKESERFDIPGRDGIFNLCISESGVYKLIMIGTTIRAEEARNYICEELLPKISK